MKTLLLNIFRHINNVNTLNLTRLFLLTTLLFLPISTFANEQVEKLEQEALLFLQSHYIKTEPNTRAEIKISPISRKIKLKACTQPIAFQTPRGNSNRITFKARCPSALWQLFITAKVNLYGKAVVSITPLARNAVLEAQQLSTKEVDLTNIQRGHFNSIKQITGWSTKRSIPANAIITANMLKPPMTISKGNAVIIEAKRTGVTIRTSGTALQSGSKGEQISVRNDRSGKSVKAVIIEAGLVRTP